MPNPLLKNFFDNHRPIMLFITGAIDQLDGKKPMAATQTAQFTLARQRLKALLEEIERLST